MALRKIADMKRRFQREARESLTAVPTLRDAEFAEESRGKQSKGR
jgi:hypothetical protein